MTVNGEQAIMLRFSYFILCGILQLSTSCFHNQDDAQILPNDPSITLIRNSRYMEDLFEADTVLLKIPADFAISEISSIHLTSENQILISDGFFTNKALQFDENGLFIQQIGKNGQGPGEYLTPMYVLTNSKNEIIVGDLNLHRILFFNQSGQYLRSFSIHQTAEGVYLSAQDEIIIHTQRASLGKTTIFVYDDKDGKLLRKFGGASQAFRRLPNLAITFNTRGPHLTVLGESIYELDFVDYHFREFSSSGEYEQEFGIKPEEWRSLLTTNYQLLPPPGFATNDYISQLKNYLDNELTRCTITEFILAIGPKMLCIGYRNGHKSGFRRAFYYDFYLRNGSLVNSGLTFKNFPKLSNFPPSILLKAPPDKLYIAQFLDKAKRHFQEINLIRLRLKTAIE